MYRIQWGVGNEAKVSTIQDLDLALDEIHCGHQPVMAVVESLKSGNSLAIGLGLNHSVLNFVSGSGDPPYFTSLGSTTGKETIEFNFMGANSEFSIKNAIPIDKSRSAMRRFFESDKIPMCINWEED